MSGLSRALAARGAIVSGSDMAPSPSTRALRSDGFEVSFDQAEGTLPPALDLVVASAAIRPDHPQLIEAESRGLEVLTYAEALGRCMLGRTGVAIAGTHGKSTTAALLGTILVDAGLDPTVVVGATCAQLPAGALCDPCHARDDNGFAPTGFRIGSDSIPSGTRAGEPGILIAEACEFNRSFHNLHPRIACIGSVEADHLDIYGSLDAVVEAFNEFALRLPPEDEGGLLLIAHEGAHRREVTRGVHARVETIGASPSADWQIVYDPEARTIELRREGDAVCQWTTRLPGEHNARNAAAACALAISLGANPAKLAESLAAFQGVDRRVQCLGQRPARLAPADAPGIHIYDDYGHHPTEIEATLTAIRQFEKPHDRGGRLICVFQPHQHSRTRHLLDEFASAFSEADMVIVPHIYFVRDSEIEKTKVSAGDLVDRLRQRNVRAMHVYPFEAIVEQLDTLCRPGDVVLVMGAGPVWKVARDFLAGEDSLREQSA